VRRRGRLAWGVAAAGAIAWALFPVAWLVSLSLKRGDDVHARRFLPAAFTLDNYRAVFRTSLFTSALLNSVGISLASTAASVSVAALAAFAIARLDLPGRRWILGMALAVSMFPVIAIVGPLFDLWRTIGLYDTWPGLAIPYLSFTLPLSIWVLTTHFRQLPWELEEAAIMDGATRWQAFRKVMVPLAAPGVATAAILTFLFAWNDFVFGISLTSTDRARPVPAALAFFTGESQFQDPTTALAAAAVVITVPVAALVMLFQRRIVSGLTSGAVKG
jgi:multiple sugar transport system permease protein